MKTSKISDFTSCRHLSYSTLLLLLTLSALYFVVTKGPVGSIAFYMVLPIEFLAVLEESGIEGLEVSGLISLDFIYLLYPLCTWNYNFAVVGLYLWGIFYGVSTILKSLFLFYPT